MNSIVNSVKHFIGNKNIVTVIGVILIMVILYFGYNAQLKSATNPVQVPVAKTSIQPRTKITKELIETITVPSVGVRGSVITNMNSIIGKYTNINVIIPQGSMFYTSALVTAEELPDSTYTQVKEGDVPYNFHVTMDSTYGNSMLPGNKVDFYMKAENDDGEVMVGKLIENVEILAVKDSAGKDVFENTEESRTPAYFIVGISNEIHILLLKAKYMHSNSIEVFPVPHGGAVDESGETRVTTQYLKDFINSKTVDIPLDELEEANTQNNG